MEIREPEMVRLSKNDKPKKLWKQILEFIGLYIGITVIEIIATLILYVIISIACGVVVSAQAASVVGDNYEEMMEFVTNMANEIFTPRLDSYIALYSTITISISVILYCKIFKKRSLRSIGFQKKNVFRDYMIGLIIGLIMIFIAILIDTLIGKTRIIGISEGLNKTSILFIILYFFGFMLQGASEEILVRGFFMTEIGAKNKIVTAIITSSFIFMLAHILNPGITIPELISIFFVGVFLSLYIICFDNIWGACAIHTIWNFVQANIFGTDTLLNITDSVFQSAVIKSNTLGGQLTEGISAIIFWGIAIGLLLLYMKKTGRITKTVKEDKALEIES